MSMALLTPVDYWFGEPPWLTLDASSDTRTRQRRVSRSATLDGGCLINDGGYAEADRELRLAVRGLSRADAAVLEAIAAFPLCHLALDHGLYRGVVSGYAFNGGATAALTFLVTARII